MMEASQKFIGIMKLRGNKGMHEVSAADEMKQQ